MIFAYLFGGLAKGDLKPLSDADVDVYLTDSVDPIGARLEVLGVTTAHLGTDEVDLVVLNTAPTALVGRILRTRRVICDRAPFRRHRFESLALRQFFVRKLPLETTVPWPPVLQPVPIGWAASRRRDQLGAIRRPAGALRRPAPARTACSSRGTSSSRW